MSNSPSAPSAPSAPSSPSSKPQQMLSQGIDAISRATAQTNADARTVKNYGDPALDKEIQYQTSAQQLARQGGQDQLDIAKQGSAFKTNEQLRYENTSGMDSASRASVIGSKEKADYDQSQANTALTNAQADLVKKGNPTQAPAMGGGGGGGGNGGGFSSSIQKEDKMSPEYQSKLESLRTQRLQNDQFQQQSMMNNQEQQGSQWMRSLAARKQLGV